MSSLSCSSDYFWAVFVVLQTALFCSGLHCSQKVAFSFYMTMTSQNRHIIGNVQYVNVKHGPSIFGSMLLFH